MCPNWGARRDALACPPPTDYVPHHVAMGGFALRMSAGMGGGWSYHSAGDPPCSAASRSYQHRCIFFGPIAEWLDENKLRIGSGQTCGHASSICPQEIDLEQWCTTGSASSTLATSLNLIPRQGCSTQKAASSAARATV